MGIPTFTMRFHLAGKLLIIKHPFVLMMPTAKLKFTLTTLNIFIQPQRKVLELECDLTSPPPPPNRIKTLVFANGERSEVLKSIA